MATNLKRYQVTQTPALEAALRTARVRWPEERRTSRLIEKLAEAGATALEEDPDVARAARRRKLAELSGKYQFEDGGDYIYALREEWDRDAWAQ
jgi:hypothetical protein